MNNNLTKKGRKRIQVLTDLFSGFIDTLKPNKEQTALFIDWRDNLQETGKISKQESDYLSNLYYQD